MAKKPESRPNVSKDELLKYYREMLLIRRFEEKAGQLYGMGAIGGFCHLYIGQEAIVVGMQMALKKGDQVITGYRDHGHMLACGMEANGVMAELTGRRGGYSKGKGGSMHMFSKEKAFYGGHGIVGANVPLGAGLAFANKYRGVDNVCFTYFGDGAGLSRRLGQFDLVWVMGGNAFVLRRAMKQSRFDSIIEDMLARDAIIYGGDGAGAAVAAGLGASVALAGAAVGAAVLAGSRPPQRIPSRVCLAERCAGQCTG